MDRVIHCGEKMKRFEYIKWFWKYIDDETPVLLFYEDGFAFIKKH